MERFLQKEQVLLGYNSRKSLGSPKIPFRNSSDVDFNDVFGGPPRRSSIQDWRHVGEGSRDSNFSKEEEREEEIHSSPWSGLSEKPVFGEESVNHRQYPSDDFFDDIFRGDESSGSTPRKLSRDPLSPSPGSRVQSPARSVPHQSDPFGSSSLPSMLSLPTKLVKDIDYPPLPGPSRSPRKNNENTPNGLGFPSSPSALSSRFSNHGIQGQDGIRNDLRSLYRQSSLSKEFSSNSDGSSQVTISDKHDPEGHWKKNSRNEIVSDSSSQFHFSIYKWPSTGVPVVMPFRGGSNLSLTDKPENKTSTFHAPVLYETELPSLVDDMLLMDKPSQQFSENQDESSVIHIRKKRVDPSEVFEEVSHVKPESKSVTELGYILKEVPRNLPSQVPEKEIKRSPNASSAAVDKGLSESTEKKFSSSKKEGQKPEHRPLYGLLKDDYDRQGNEKVIEQAKGKEGKVDKKADSKKKAQKPETAPLYCMLDDSGRQGNCVIDPDRAKEGKAKGMHPIAGDVENSKKVKKQMGKRNLSTATEAIKSTLQWSPQDEKFVSNKVKGKVKDFVKIFNRESPSKFITNAGVPERSAAVNDNGEGRVETVNDSGPNRVEDQANISANNEDGKGKVTSMKKRTSDPSNDVDQVWKQPEKPQFVINTAAQKINSMSSGRDGNSVSCSETIPEGGRATINNEEESHYPDLDCTVKELSQDPNEPQSSQLHEDLQVWDAKIRKWANGKEGNIRSLLSTLQYVLWAESGWKPVPLVDIIEGNPVKRAYQKALLCLHPDKLQQKGAAAHEKYIAEKVFDILQDAWTHFNTLGSF